MVATEDRTARIENKIDDLNGRVERVENKVDNLNGRVSRVEGTQDQMSKRLDDVHKLLITLIAIGGGGLITAVVSLVLQLVKQ